MDNRVYISFISTTLLAIFLIIYRMAYACCSIPVIMSSVESATQGVEVIFKNSGDNRELSWNFGDGSPEEFGREVSHVFNRSGETQVSATYNGQCEAELIVTVQPKIEESLREVEPFVSFTQEAKVKEPIVFTDMTPGANKWLWSVVGGEVKQTGKDPEFKTSFATPGVYTISLRVDGEKMTGTRDLTVTVVPKDGPSPPPPPPSGSSNDGSTIELNTAEFIQICNDYNSTDIGKKRVQRDLYAEVVKKHFGKMATRITFEGVPDIEISAPDFGHLSRILDKYAVKEVKLVPSPINKNNKNGFRQYKTMVVTLEEIK